ncbi:MAG TPA: FAD-dependent monooxygenase, partial [Polyangiaceae bacterium]
TGAHAIFGRTPLRDLTLPALGPLLEKSGVLSLGPRGVNFFCTTMRFPEPPAIVADRLRLDLGTCPSEDYVMWGVTSRVDSHATDPHRLKSAALALIEGFAGDFDTLVRASDVDDTITVPIRAAPKLTRWKPSRVTLLGDAIHAMPPVGANGANTALRDAQVLARCLSRGDAIEDAVGSYENEMRAYSRRLVRRGTRMMSAITSPSPLARGLLRATLRVAAWLA